MPVSVPFQYVLCDVTIIVCGVTFSVRFRLSNNDISISQQSYRDINRLWVARDGDSIAGTIGFVLHRRHNDNGMGSFEHFAEIKVRWAVRKGGNERGGCEERLCNKERFCSDCSLSKLRNQMRYHK